MIKQKQRKNQFSRKISAVRSLENERSMPKNWVLSKFDDVADVTDYVANGSFASLKENVKYKNEQDYAILVRFTDFTKNWGGKFVYVDKHAYDFLSKSYLEPGDVVIANVGDPGRVFRVPDLGQPMTIAPNSVLVRPIDQVKKGFIFYFIMSPWGQDLISQIVTGTAQKKFNKTGLRALYIPIAPFNEQKRIVAEIEKQFSRLDEAVENLKRVKANLKRYKASVLKNAVEGKLTELWRDEHSDVEPASKLLEHILTERRKKWEGVELAKMKARGKEPKDDKWKKKYKEPNLPKSNDLPSIPMQWEWANPQILAAHEDNAICAGPFGTIFKAKDFRPEGIPIIFLRHVSPGKYLTHKPGFMDTKKWDELFRPYSVYGGELLVTKLGEPPGVCAMYPSNIGPAMVTPDVIKMKVDNDFSFSTYLMHYFNSQVSKNFATGLAFGTTRLRLTLPIFKNLPVPLPPLREQELIVSEIEKRLSIAEELETEIEINIQRAERLRQSVLKSAFSGKLVPHKMSDEPASTLLERIKQERIEKDVSRASRKRDQKKGEKVKTIKSKRSLKDVLAENPSGITPEMLLKDANYSLDEIDDFYAQLGKISDQIDQVKPIGKQAFKWPFEAKVILSLKDK